MNSKSTMDSNVFNEKLYENQIINEDCITYMKKLPDKHINSFILDPPYYEVVSASWDNKWNTFNEYLQWFEEIIIELK